MVSSGVVSMGFDRLVGLVIGIGVVGVFDTGDVETEKFNSFLLSQEVGNYRAICKIVNLVLANIAVVIILHFLKP